MPPSPDPHLDRRSLVLLGFEEPPPPRSMEGAQPHLAARVVEHKVEARGLGGPSEWCGASGERCGESTRVERARVSAPFIY